MPWLDSSATQTPDAAVWQKFFKHAFVRGLTPEQTTGPLRELSRKHPVSGEGIANGLLGLRSAHGGVDHPLLFRYCESLLRASHISTADLLLALLAHSTLLSAVEASQPARDKSGSPTCEERIFTRLAQLHLAGVLSHAGHEWHGTLNVLTRWLDLVYELEYNKQMESAGLHTLDQAHYGMYEALGSLAISILSQKSIRTVSRQNWWNSRRPVVSRAMANFDLHVLQWMQSQLSGRLEAMTRIPPFVETGDNGRPIFSGQQVLNAVTDLPLVYARAGLYVWLNACLSGRPFTDDLDMLGYLQARYSGDIQPLAIELLIASFDVLTNAALRKERPNVRLARSFICNKIPLLLSTLSTYMVPPLTAEACIQVAFMSITMDALPPISAGANEVREVLKRTRLECLQACALHGLATETTIASILQEPAIALPRVTRYTKEGLLAQCTNNVGRLEALVDDLPGMQGNAGAISGCVVGLIGVLCLNKDTMSLKTVCNMLTRRLPDMDVVMQYTQPATLILPICALLNDWAHDQDQAEFTPSYEEFASILLFALAFIHRYNLTRSDVGLASTDNFVFQLLHAMSSSKSLPDLTEEQRTQLSRWVEGLFSTDEQGESSGISDDVMRHCPPQAFYLLVPTLFEQSVQACKSKILPMKIFKGGLELLLEPFLLPSLVVGLSWLVDHSWEDHGDVDILMQILDKVMKPSSSSQETQAMHKAVMCIVADPLSRSLQDLQRKRPDRKDVQGLIGLLKPIVGHRRTLITGRADIEEWASTDGGLEQCIRNTVRDLVLWSLSVGPNPPIRYTHGLLATTLPMIGAEKVLRALSSAMQEQTRAGSGAQALDVCASMICASAVTSRPSATALGGSVGQGKPHTSLREHLQLTVADTLGLLDRPLAEAESLVRLARRVETQLAVPQGAQLPLAVPATEHVTDQMMQELGLADAALVDTTIADLPLETSVATIGNGADTAHDETGMNLDFGQSLDLTGDLSNLAPDGTVMTTSGNIFEGFGMDMTQPAQENQPLVQVGDSIQQDPNQEEDIFAGLDMSMGDLGDDFTFS